MINICQEKEKTIFTSLTIHKTRITIHISKYSFTSSNLNIIPSYFSETNQQMIKNCFLVSRRWSRIVQCPYLLSLIDWSNYHEPSSMDRGPQIYLSPCNEVDPRKLFSCSGALNTDNEAFIFWSSIFDLLPFAFVYTYLMQECAPRGFILQSAIYCGKPACCSSLW